VHLTRWRHPGLVFIAVLLFAALALRASADDNRFEIRNAYVELAEGTWELEVRLDLALSKSARQAFDEGVPLTLLLEAEATTARRFLPDETVVSLTREWQLAYDAIADRYVVTDRESGEHTSHASRDEALEALARISQLPIADTEKLPANERFEMRVRASVEIGELPAAIKLLLFWKSWSRSTDWYTWNVRP
jgi:uncharacterized protein DUF4390